MTTTFGITDEAVYYTLLLMPPNGDSAQAYGYTTVEIFDFWTANHESNTLLAAHSPSSLTLAEVETAILLGSARALYRIVFSGDADSRYDVNEFTRQLPVPSKKFLIRIGIFDKEIAAALATCRIVNSTYAPSPALASSVQPPTRPDLFTLSIQVPANGIVGPCPTDAQVDVVATSLALSGSTSCEVASL